ncbi:proteasome 26S subunit [Histoplasma capsulatum H143]|uniref:Proteasome 26S subunit n=1 Tax=Ajellomyces capsulatus (strain H143) TaxID=544712 RepID=C6HLN6_AJECH|nr:proteasome 26S subunit [Histoplasma capsulatum H143]
MELDMAVEKYVRYIDMSHTAPHSTPFHGLCMTDTKVIRPDVVGSVCASRLQGPDPNRQCPRFECHMIGIAWHPHGCWTLTKLASFASSQGNRTSRNTTSLKQPLTPSPPSLLLIRIQVLVQTTCASRDTSSRIQPVFPRFSGSSSSLQHRGNQQSNMGGGGPGDSQDEKDKKKEKPKYEPPPQPTTRIGRRKRKQAGPNASAKLPAIYPTSRCKLKYLRMQRIHDHLLLEEEYVENQERIRKTKTSEVASMTCAEAPWV